MKRPKAHGIFSARLPSFCYDNLAAQMRSAAAADCFAALRPQCEQTWLCASCRWSPGVAAAPDLVATLLRCSSRQIVPGERPNDRSIAEITASMLAVNLYPLLKAELAVMLAHRNNTL